MQSGNIFVILFITGTVFSFLLEEGLEYIDFRARRKNGSSVPTELFGYMDSKLLKRTCAYENDRYFLFIPEHCLGTILSLVLVCSGFYVRLFQWAWNLSHNAYLAAMLFFLLSSLPSALIELPFSLYEEFSIEKKYGFSTMTPGLWIVDALKNIVLELVLSIPLICAAVFLLLHAQSWWWLLLGIIYVTFSAGISFVYPVWIAPLFNTFTPLQDRELKSRLERLLQKTGFASDGIFLMDASKRSRHSNAYFTGFGKNKRVVLYDTLTNLLSAEETEAVLGHELGHYKLHHIVRRLCVMIPLVFIALYAASILIQIPALYSGFGFATGAEFLVGGSPAGIPREMTFIGIFLLALVAEGFLPVPAAIANICSRHDEFAADKFSARLCGNGRPLCTALIKLNKDNLAEVTTPKIYSICKDSHPPLLERIRALKNFRQEEETEG